MKIFECDDGEFWDQETQHCEKILEREEVKPTIETNKIRNLALSIKNALIEPNNTVIDSDLRLNTQHSIENNFNPIQFPQFNAQPQEIAINPCSTITITDSSISLVNGVYSKIKTVEELAKFPTYRRSDDVKLPGLIVAINEQNWCITYSFSLVDMKSLTEKKISEQCENLKCCLLIGDIVLDSNNNAVELNNSSLQWSLNPLGIRGSPDQGLRIACGNLDKSKFILDKFFKLRTN